MTLTVLLHWSPYTGDSKSIICHAGRLCAGYVTRTHKGYFKWRASLGAKAAGSEDDIDAAKRAVENHVKQFLSM